MYLKSETKERKERNMRAHDLVCLKYDVKMKGNESYFLKRSLHVFYRNGILFLECLLYFTAAAVDC